MDKFTAEVIGSPAAANLKLISRWGVGYDAIDIAAATRHGIIVAYTPGMLNETVADCAFALLLTLARRIHLGHMGMIQGEWKPAWGNDVFGKTLGILGCGRIGQAVARRASGFNMRLLGYDVAPQEQARNLGIEFVSLDELLSQSDFVSLHSALTPENRGLLGEAQLRRRVHRDLARRRTDTTGPPARPHPGRTGHRDRRGDGDRRRRIGPSGGRGRAPGAGRGRGVRP
jgi:lactate dehydrogenase-like 2-hydroxyacid dehydrogenase